MEQIGLQEAGTTTETLSDEPKNFIIWLDKHIGKPEECILLKCSFFMAMNPTSGLFERNLEPNDIDRSISLKVSMLIRLDEVEFMFQAFEDIERCFLTIERNRHKRIFFITSGSKGRIIVPSLVVNFPETFVQEYWMYIFCANMNMTDVQGGPAPTNSWALDYVDHVLMFNYQDDLLARMVLEMARYFYTEAERLAIEDELHSARQHYKWSIIMYLRYEKLEDKRKTDLIDEINQRIENLTQRIQQNLNNEDDDVLGASPS